MPAKKKMSDSQLNAHMQQIGHRKLMLGPNPFPFREKKFAEESTKKLREKQSMQKSQSLAGPSRSQLLHEQEFASRTKELKERSSPSAYKPPSPPSRSSLLKARGTKSSATRKLIK
jgi:hypothetical protein